MYYREKIIDGFVFCQTSPHGKWRKLRMATAEEQYPEYAKEANEIAMNACRAINNASIALYRERGIKCPYPAQCLLEMVVKDLEARI